MPRPRTLSQPRKVHVCITLRKPAISSRRGPGKEALNSGVTSAESLPEAMSPSNLSTGVGGVAPGSRVGRRYGGVKTGSRIPAMPRAMASGFACARLANTMTGRVEVRITLNGGLEAQPGAAVPDPPIAALLGEIPAETVGVRATVVEPDRCPAHLQTGAAEHLPMVESDGPLRQVTHGKTEAAVGGGIDRG